MMNKINATITGLETSEHLTLVTMNAFGEDFCAIVIETPETAAYLEAGRQVNLVFKETEVILALNRISDVSLTNQFQVSIKKIRKGKILSELLLDFQGNSVSSIIPTLFIEKMHLEPGQSLFALVKSNEVMIMP